VLSQAANVYMTMYSIVSGQLFSERLQRKTNKFSYFFHPAYTKKIFPDTNFVRSYELMHTPKEKNFFILEVEPTPPQDFQASSSSIALVGSILAGVYMLVGPIAAASVNRLVVELKGR
jgi:hypothetical protein